MSALLLSPAAVAASFTALILQYGEPITTVRGGADTNKRFIVTSANNIMISQFVDDNTAVGLAHPCVIVHTDVTAGGSNQAPLPNDQFTRDGRTFNIQAVLPYRLNQQVIVYSCLAS